MTCICSICLGSLSEDPTGGSTNGPNAKMARPSNPAQTVQLVSPRCGHIFHRACLTAWLNTGNNICPSCREICGGNALKPVFLLTSQSSSSATVSLTRTPSTGSLTTQLRQKIADDAHEELLEDLDEVRHERQHLERRHDLLISVHNGATRTISDHRLTIQQLEASKKDLTNKLDVETKAHMSMEKELDQKYKKISDLIVDNLKLRKKVRNQRSLVKKKSQSGASEPDEDGDGDEVYNDDEDHDKLTSDLVIDDDDDE